MSSGIKKLHAAQETRVWSLHCEDPLEKGMATHSSILAWRIPWSEEHGGLQSKGSQRVRHDWATNLKSPTHWRHCGVFMQAFLPTAVGKKSIDYLDLTRKELEPCWRIPLVSQILGFKMKPGLISCRRRMQCGLGKVFLWNCLYSPQNAAGLLDELKILNIGFEFLSNHLCSTRVKKH